MSVEDVFRGVVDGALRALEAEGRLPAGLPRAFAVERPKRAEHGDLATNAPLTLAKAARLPPREIASMLAERVAADARVTSAEAAGAGFVNVRLAPAAYHPVLDEVLRAGRGYGRAPAATGERVLIEFVSANPTGPLLISHARGALVGDAIARLLEATGHLVAREYYINDFGNQVQLFALSVAAAAFGEPLPEGGYPGAYVDAVAGYLKEREPAALEAYRASRGGDELAALARLCVTRMLDGVPGSADLPGIKATLRSLGVHYDAWFSEESLHRWGRVGAALARLEAGGYLRELPDGALVFQMPEGEGLADGAWKRAEASKDAGGGRVVRKSDRRTYTYFASDIAYHADKIDRGYGRVMTVLGADHHGYQARLVNMLAALGLPKERLDILFFQLVSLVRDGQVVRMGKRLGNLITVDEVLEEIDEALGPGAGADALRYFYLSRRLENPVELDVDLAKRASIENPAIYLQYGHARLCSLLRVAKAELGLSPPPYDPRLAARLTHPLELSIVQRLGEYPKTVRLAADERAPSRVVSYLDDLAREFNAYYTQTKDDPILPKKSVRAQPNWEATWDREKTLARLGWVDGIRTVYASGLALLGIRAPERLERLEGPAEAGEGAEAPPAT
ncbi:MAG TPA: arginine--tRNA ligase [Polyangiaceae bacterium]|nr:arginine--tRNA ligase [Polyangiaceae bacterium]